MKKTKRAYWAGFLDGEGTIRIAKTGNSHFLAISLVQNKRGVIEEAKKDFGCGSVGTSTMKERIINGVITTKKTVIWYWNSSTNQAEEALKMLLPYLIVKKEQAKIALKFQEYRRRTDIRGKRTKEGYQKMSEEVINKRESFKKEISRLNNKI